MGNVLRFVVVLTSVLLTGCAESHAGDDLDAAAPDVSSMPRVDGGRPPLDAPRTADDRLSRFRRCGLTAAEALEASVRHSAVFHHAGVTLSVRAEFEAWQAGAFSGLTELSADWDPGLGCEVWRCMVGARTLGEAVECLNPGGPCTLGRRWCQDGVLHDCGTGSDRTISCVELGGTCNTDHCELASCTFTVHGDVSEVLSCVDGDIAMCGGALWIDCDTEEAGTRCGNLLISDILPLVACRPAGTTATSPANAPVTCDAGVLSFTSIYGDSHSYDCLANGFIGCDEWGCIFAD